MTREEIKNIVRHVFHFYEVNAENCNWADMNEACGEIFKALEQEPCEDCISRQAALDCLTATKLKKFDFILHAREEIKKLPPVTPQQKIGRWIYGEDNSGTGRDGWYCNQCGHFEFWDYSSDMKSAELNLPNLCPNCKTKMQEDKDKKLRLRTKGEKEAYLDGFEMCAECIESYLKPDVRQYLRHLLVVVKKSLKIEDIEPQERSGEE